MNSQLRLLAVPGYVLLIGLVCSTAVALNLAAVAGEKDADRFDYAVAQTHDTIEDRVDTYVAMLEAGAAMLAAVDLDLSKAEFHAFAQRVNLSGRYPGVQGVGYSVRIRRNSGPLVTEMMQRQGVSDFAFWPQEADDSGERHAILYLEPLDDRNDAAIGYNMFSEATRRAAMERARDTGRPSASGRVELVQEITEDKQAGFLIYVPVYEGGDPGELEARRDRLAGFVYSPFRADDLMSGIFGEAPNPRLHIALYDGEPRLENLMHVSAGGETALLGGRGPAPRFNATRTLDIGARSWTAVYASRPEFEYSSSAQLAPLAFIAGIVVTLILASVAWWQARTYQLAARRTRELEVFNALGVALVAELDPGRLVQAVTDAGAELTGAGFGAFFENAGENGETELRLSATSGAPVAAVAQTAAAAEAARAACAAKLVLRETDIAATDGEGGTGEGGLPMRSWLAAPVMGRSGDVLGGLAFGHRKAGRFDARSERVIASLAAQAAIALDNANLWRDMRGEMDHRKLLLDELNHRVKNTLATVQSMAAQTLRGADSLPRFHQAFESRLIALSSTHNLLTKGAWKGASLRELLKAELAPFEHESGRVTMDGPDVRLRPAEATSLGMAFHELTTNAVKYGALSRPEGRLHVGWSLTPFEGRECLSLEWRERGGPQVSPPGRRGFGSRLIERGLVAQHNGKAEMRFEPEGLTCTIDIPLAPASEEDEAA